MKLTLCIPTMDRMDTFLGDNLRKYLDNDLIDEIVICDENGNDYTKLLATFPNQPKLKIFRDTCYTCAQKPIFGFESQKACNTVTYTKNKKI